MAAATHGYREEFATTSILGVSISYQVHEPSHILADLSTPGVEPVSVSISWVAISVQAVGRMTALGIFFGARSGPVTCLIAGAAVAYWATAWVGSMCFTSYSSSPFRGGQAVLTAVRPSIGTVGDAYAHALMESINGLYKAECIRSTVFGPGEREYKTLLDVKLATSAWVQWWKTDRLHSSIGMRTSLEHKAAYYAAHTQTEQTPV